MKFEQVIRSRCHLHVDLYNLGRILIFVQKIKIG